MKPIYALALSALVFTSCVNNNSSDNSNQEMVEPEVHKELYGMYVGFLSSSDDYDEYKENDVYFSPVKISIIIHNITAQGAKAKAFINGLEHHLTGTYTQETKGMKFKMDEKSPQAKELGTYEFVVTTDSLIGVWTSLNKNSDNPRKKYELHKQAFKYDPQVMLSKEWSYVDWETPVKKEYTSDNIDGSKDKYIQEEFRTASEIVTEINSSTEKLTEAQLKNLKKLELEILRNTIYARHGYAFKKSSVRNFFEMMDWYMPISDNVDAELTELEKSNIELLQRMEKYAQDTYEYFGR